MHSPGDIGDHFCSINDAIPMQFGSTEDVTQQADEATCYPASATINWRLSGKLLGHHLKLVP